MTPSLKTARHHKAERTLDPWPLTYKRPDFQDTTVRSGDTDPRGHNSSRLCCRGHLRCHPTEGVRGAPGRKQGGPRPCHCLQHTSPSPGRQSGRGSQRTAASAWVFREQSLSLSGLPRWTNCAPMWPCGVTAGWRLPGPLHPPPPPQPGAGPLHLLH